MMTKQTSLLAPGPQVEAAIRYDMSEQDYRAASGLSNSMLKDLEVSPLRFWFRHVNHNPPMEEPSPYLIFGEALHCAVLEPGAFTSRYVQELDQADYPNVLDTVPKIREWIKSKGKEAKGQLKADVKKCARLIDPNIQFWDDIEQAHIDANHGKEMLSKDFYTRVNGCAESLLSEPVVRELLKEGHPEVSVFARDPETGVLLKSRMDWVTPSGTIPDLKTFTQKRGASIEKSIGDAIFYEKYHRQGWFYKYVASLQKNAPDRLRYINIFVESDPPHDVRIKELKAGNIYWEIARAEMQGLIRLYADCLERFGDKPWRDEQAVEELTDEDVKQFAY